MANSNGKNGSKAGLKTFDTDSLIDRAMATLKNIDIGVNSGSEPQGFTNQFELNQTCMVLIVVFVLLFMYKKEVMAMVNKYLK